MFSERINRLKRLTGEQLTNRVIKSTSEKLLQLNRDQLTLHGIYSDGSLISAQHPYSPRTVFLKTADGTLTNGDPTIVNLRDTQAFQDAFVITSKGGDSWLITSTDGKTGKLVSKYGDQIFGLTVNNLDVYNRGVFLPEYLREFRKII